MWPRSSSRSVFLGLARPRERREPPWRAEGGHQAAGRLEGIDPASFGAVAAIIATAPVGCSRSTTRPVGSRGRGPTPGPPRPTRWPHRPVGHRGCRDTVAARTAAGRRSSFDGATGVACRSVPRGAPPSDRGSPGTLSEASIAQGLAYGGWRTASIVIWLVVLALGRMPPPLYEATVAVLRYRMRHTAYLTMLSSAYPKRLFGEEPGSEPEGPASGTRPLALVGVGRGLLVLFLLLGPASWATGSVAVSVNSDDDGNDEFINPTQRVLAPLVPGPADPVGGRSQGHGLL
ncbi:DUF4389 domain-containing protein [Kitasatospora sp. NPDC087271]|uniref:DUF4389 domain-containing protein n=1 Tax=Kitasatospora sp. NPDC087271 TaxID=3364067 RepID=UPI00381B2307